jgi:predicted alpha/beta superfamily hydrolase
LLTLDDALTELRADPNGALLAFTKQFGLPLKLADGTTLFATTGNLRELAGDFDNWTPESMTDEGSFAWLARNVSAAQGYKFTDGTNFAADELSRAYTWDSFGEMSLTSRKAEANIGGRERHFEVSGFGLQSRTVRVLFPTGIATHVLYAHDGQNLFDRDNAPFGGWFIDDVLPDDVMVVGIDNTSDRFGEYTPVQDDIGTGSLVGGESAQYGDMIESEVRPLIAKWYGEPAVVGTMGSSLGGLVSFDIAERHPDIAFAASLSGTFGWGSIGAGVHNETVIQRYENHAHTNVTLYLDSGGTASGCADLDGDGIDDDVDAGDNSCETLQLRDVLRADGWQDNVDLFYVIQEGAIHNEAAWASRVGNVLAIFSSL